MIVLGIDPGTAITGYGVVRSGRDRLEALDYGCLFTQAGEPARERLKAIHDGVLALIDRHSPDAIAIEKLFFCRNITTAMAVGEARGAVLVAAASSRALLCEFTPMQVKQAVTGYGRAEKQQVQAMVRTLLGLRESPRPDDAADALASAIAGIHFIETASRMGAGALLGVST